MEQYYLNKKEVRKAVGNVSDTTIWRWVQQGIFPSPRRVGPNRLGWLSNDIKDWIESREIATPEQVERVSANA